MLQNIVFTRVVKNGYFVRVSLITLVKNHSWRSWGGYKTNKCPELKSKRNQSESHRGTHSSRAPGQSQFKIPPVDLASIAYARQTPSAQRPTGNYLCTRRSLPDANRFVLDRFIINRYEILSVAQASGGRQCFRAY